MGHQDPCRRHHPHQLQRFEGSLLFQGGAFHRHQPVHRNAFGMGVHAGQHLQHGGAVPQGFTHADDAAAAEGDAGLAHPLQGFQPFLIGAGGDDPVVVLGAGVEVVVVGREAGFGQTFRLLVGEHPRGHAGFHPHAAHPSHHLEHRLKGSAIADLPPGPAHAEAISSGFLGGPGPLKHRLHLHLGFKGRHVTAVVDRLRAVGTVFFAAPRFHAQQRGQLHPVARVGFPMHGLGLPEQLHQGKFQQGLDLLGGPVVADAEGHGRIGSRPPKRRWRRWKSSRAAFSASALKSGQSTSVT